MSGSITGRSAAWLARGWFGLALALVVLAMALLSALGGKFPLAMAQAFAGVMVALAFWTARREPDKT